MLWVIVKMVLGIGGGEKQPKPLIKFVIGAPFALCEDFAFGCLQHEGPDACFALAFHLCVGVIDGAIPLVEEGGAVLDGEVGGIGGIKGCSIARGRGLRGSFTLNCAGAYGGLSFTTLAAHPNSTRLQWIKRLSA